MACPVRPVARGAGMVELLVGLAIVAVLIGAVAPSVRSSLAEVELRAAAVGLAAAVTRGRAGARAEGRPWELRVLGTTAYAVGPIDGPSSEERLPGGAVFAAATSQGTVRLQPSGTAENATFTLALGGRERRVVVNQRGRITLE